MKRLHWLTRTLAVLLCAAMLATAGSVALFAEDAPEAVAVQATEEEQTNSEGKPMNFLDKFLSIFNWYGYTVDWATRFVYTQSPVWQWLGGYNTLYDSFAFLALTYPDTIKSNFVYDGKEWLIQFWKGSFAVCLATGAEIGVYNRSEGAKINHYLSATKDDMLQMKMEVFFKTAKLFEREGKFWWCNGFMPNLNLDMFRKPRTNVVMDATIEFKDADMADAFVASLIDIGFCASLLTTGAEADIRDADALQYVDAQTVRIIWQNFTDNWY